MGINKISCKKYIYGGLLAVAAFVMLLAFWDKMLFPSDEEEIFVKGQAIAKGLLLYTDISSQHMPLMYYIAAFFSLVGASSVVSFRVCFYLLQAMLWGLMYVRYSERFGKATLILYPCLYISFMAMIGSGHCVLSEQFQGIGMAILFFELMSFYKTRSLKIGNQLMISLAVLLSFGSAFVSIFAIFIVWLTVFMIETRTCIQKKTGILGWLGFLIKKYWLLILIVALPFAVMLIYIASVGSLKDFYSWAYVVNRVVYPKYNLDYNGKILHSLFGGIAKYFESLNISVFSVSTISAAFLVLLCVLFLTKQHMQNKDVILTGGLIMLLITSATRGFIYFHGLPAVAVACCMGAVYLSDAYSSIKNDSSIAKRVCIIFCVMLIGSKYMTFFPDAFNVSLSGYERTAEGTALDIITDDNERVGFSTLDYNILMEAKVIPASVYGGACIWMWEWGQEQAMEELTSNPPRVFLYNKDIAVWDYPILEYAGDLNDFINDNYTSLEGLGYPTLYVRNDYYDEAVRKLNSTIALVSGNPDSMTP